MTSRPSVTRDTTPRATPAATPPRRTTGTAVWLALAAVYVVWGSTYLAIRVTVETIPPFLSAGARFVVAGLLLAAFLAWRRGPAVLRLTGRQLASSALVGLLLLLGGNGLVVLAETDIPSGLAALLVASVPVWIVLLRRVTGDRPAPAMYGGVGLGMAGLVVLTLPGLSGDVQLGGVLTVVVGTLLWAVGSFSSGRLPMPADPLAASAYEMLAGGLGCLALGFARGEYGALDIGEISGRSWVALAYLVVFGSLVAFTAYVWLLHTAPLSLVATYAYVNPVVAVLLGALILGESVSWPIVLGGAVVVSGVCVVVSAERRPE
ncbi:putative inner membrane transporter YedA [Streptomyces sp. RB5]|uniref:Putative inner membrane transporter YedA n=1 Tax=Streptomyces smaragdinus TaxID=2585196 RepID=A0A7K0CIE1_9ACTN|nr:EamA family transporter [Streptomyces smaragdinus]MQY13250.1 putative inner membrane transporter YedA [Streptomyces smaragdinus]